MHSNVGVYDSQGDICCWGRETCHRISRQVSEAMGGVKGGGRRRRQSCFLHVQGLEAAHGVQASFLCLPSLHSVFSPSTAFPCSSPVPVPLLTFPQPSSLSFLCFSLTCLRSPSGMSTMLLLARTWPLRMRTPMV